jgi:hypothetical protein
MRIICAIAAAEKLELCQIDIENAYLNGKIDTPVYMTQSKGYVHSVYSDTVIFVCLFLKSIYGTMNI